MVEIKMADYDCFCLYFYFTSTKEIIEMKNVEIRK